MMTSMGCAFPQQDSRHCSSCSPCSPWSPFLSLDSSAITGLSLRSQKRTLPNPMRRLSPTPPPLLPPLRLFNSRSAGGSGLGSSNSRHPGCGQPCFEVQHNTVLGIRRYQNNCLADCGYKEVKKRTTTYIRFEKKNLCCVLCVRKLSEHKCENDLQTEARSKSITQPPLNCEKVRCVLDIGSQFFLKKRVPNDSSFKPVGFAIPLKTL